MMRQQTTYDERGGSSVVWRGTTVILGGHPSILRWIRVCCVDKIWGKFRTQKPSKMRSNKSVVNFGARESRLKQRARSRALVCVVRLWMAFKTLVLSCSCLYACIYVWFFEYLTHSLTAKFSKPNPCAVIARVNLQGCSLSSLLDRQSYHHHHHHLEF